MKNTNIIKYVKITAYVVMVIVALVAVFLGLWIIRSKKAPIVFSNKEMLNAIWERYKVGYLEQGTSRTIDKQRNNITTSEGEGYTMLRAVWLDDHSTFDASWQWTKDNLQFKNGYLFSWLFGKRADGSYGILIAENGQNSASDADTDIATALLFAYARWQNVKYLDAADNIVKAIWNEEVVYIDGKPYMTADNIEKNSKSYVEVNPSYFSPSSYRIFAQIDPEHDWNGLIDDSYSVIEKSMQSALDKQKSDGLPPDWLAESRVDASLWSPSKAVVVATSSSDTDFSYDALRVPWRIALDWQWNRDPRDLDILNSMTMLVSEWQKRGLLYSDYSHDGMPVQPTVESPSMYGGTIGAFMIMDALAAKNIYDTKLISLYSPDSYSWKMTLDYYDDNWAWFGIALYDNELPDLWATVTKE